MAFLEEDSSLADEQEAPRRFWHGLAYLYKIPFGNTWFKEGRERDGVLLPPELLQVADPRH